MKLGFSGMNNPSDVPPGHLAVELEGRGFESLWYGEHSHIPVSRLTPYPAGGEMPDLYKSMMDPFQSLLLAAVAAPTLVVGTSVALPLEHDLFDLAKTVASLDHHCEARLCFGVGVGWNVEELANHRRLPWSQRYRALGECVAALKALWADGESGFHGDFFDFDPVWSQPKPVQRPHPPILCGTGGRIGTREAIDWADGWMPTDVALGDVATKISKFRQAASDAGRDPAGLPITMVTFGDPALAALASYRDLGVDRTVIGPARTGWSDPATTLPYLDRYAGMISELAAP